MPRLQQIYHLSHLKLLSYLQFAIQSHTANPLFLNFECRYPNRTPDCSSSSAQPVVSRTPSILRGEAPDLQARLRALNSAIWAVNSTQTVRREYANLIGLEGACPSVADRSGTPVCGWNCSADPAELDMKGQLGNSAKCVSVCRFFSYKYISDLQSAAVSLSADQEKRRWENASGRSSPRRRKKTRTKFWFPQFVRTQVEIRTQILWHYSWH